MSMSSDPKRSFEDPSLPDALRSALAAARADRPSAESMSRVAARLGVAGSSTGGNAAGAISARTKLVAIAALCMLGGAALHAARTDEASPSRVIAAAPEAEEPASSKGATLPEPPPPPVSVREATVDALEPPSPPAAPRKARVKERSGPRDSLDPNAELELMRRAQAALTPAPSRALALCEEHARRFPRGAFQQERELIAVVALVNRGELQAAQARATRFRRAYPDSVHEPRLEALLRAHKNGELGAPKGEPATSRPSTGE